MLSSIGYLADPNPARFRALAPHYRLDLGQTTGGFHWLSHCEHCAAKQGDFQILESCPDTSSRRC